MSASGEKRSLGLTSKCTLWRTPRSLFDPLNLEFRFDLDAAASPENALCDDYLTEAHDALQCDWSGQSAFANPPYGAGMDRWINAAYRAAIRGRTVVMLVPNATDAGWFKTGWFTCHEVRLLSGRVRFEHSTPCRCGQTETAMSNTAGSALLIWRDGVRSLEKYRDPAVRLVSY